MIDPAQRPPVTANCGGSIAAPGATTGATKREASRT
jgi:hypothetical protein